MCQSCAHLAKRWCKGETGLYPLHLQRRVAIETTRMCWTFANLSPKTSTRILIFLLCTCRCTSLQQSTRLVSGSNKTCRTDNSARWLVFWPNNSLFFALLSLSWQLVWFQGDKFRHETQQNWNNFFTNFFSGGNYYGAFSESATDWEKTGAVFGKNGCSRRGIDWNLPAISIDYGKMSYRLWENEPPTLGKWATDFGKMSHRLWENEPPTLGKWATDFGEMSSGDAWKFETSCFKKYH